MYSVTDTMGLPIIGFPIRWSPDQRMLAPPRGLSQLATTFIAYQCQGIHHTPLLAWPYYSVSFNKTKLTLALMILDLPYLIIRLDAYFKDPCKTHFCIRIWRWTGSNRWPTACKAVALPAELHPLYCTFIWLSVTCMYSHLTGLFDTTNRIYLQKQRIQ